jgi:hypothetical protein
VLAQLCITIFDTSEISSTASQRRVRETQVIRIIGRKKEYSNAS